MGKVYRILAVLCAVVIIIANHADNKAICNVGAICLIIASIGYEILKRNNAKKRQ